MDGGRALSFVSHRYAVHSRRIVAFVLLWLGLAGLPGTHPAGLLAVLDGELFRWLAVGAGLGLFVFGDLYPFMGAVRPQAAPEPRLPLDTPLRAKRRQLRVQAMVRDFLGEIEEMKNFRLNQQAAEGWAGRVTKALQELVHEDHWKQWIGIQTPPPKSERDDRPEWKRLFTARGVWLQMFNARLTGDYVRRNLDLERTYHFPSGEAV